MIDFRYHVVSIVAIFLALATGIALGAGPLNGQFKKSLADEAQQDREAKVDLRTQVDELEQQAAFIDTFAGQAGADLTQGKLADRSVALFVLPGASSDDVASIEEQVTQSGGTVTANVAIGSDLLDPDKRQLAEGLATQVLDGVPGVANTDGASSYQLVGLSLARGFLSEETAGEPVDLPARTITRSYAEAEFLSVDADAERRANLAVIVAGDPAADAVSGQDELLATVAQSMDQVSGGVVVIGPTAAAGTNGFVAAIRDNDAADNVSTVDSVGTRAGQAVTILALAQQAGGGVGQYGAVDVSDTALDALIKP